LETLAHWGVYVIAMYKSIAMLTYILGRLFICREILSISVENTEAVGKHN